MASDEMKMKIDLQGWADGLNEKTKVEFALQMAMYKVAGDCDWTLSFTTKSHNGYVTHPWDISVIAKRCYSSNSEINNIEEYRFSFVIPEFTLAHIYKATVAAVQNLKAKKYAVKKRNV